MLSRKQLIHLYLHERRSSAEVAQLLGCSTHKVDYWLAKYYIPKRTISDAIYAKHNPEGDPFRWREPKTVAEAELKGLGLGIYWGEGTRKNKTSLRLGNTDPRLLQTFLEFLEAICGMDRRRLRFSLQVFSDTDAGVARRFWCRQLSIVHSQFSKTSVTPSRGIGTYKSKSQYGVLMVYVHNRKLRDLVCHKLEGLGSRPSSSTAEQFHGKDQTRVRLSPRAQR